MVRRRAYTLIESVVAIGSASVLIGAMGSLIMMSSLAIPGADDRGPVSASGLATVQRMAEDAHLATSVVTGVGSVSLLVPDRTGDSIDDPVAYWLDGTNLRIGQTVLEANPDTILTDVQSFTVTRVDGPVGLRALRLTIQQAGSTPLVTSVEIVGRP